MQEENSMMSSAQAQKQRDNANNANNIRAAADVASKTSNPYAKAIGTGVKVADKISGGKASEKLGKALTTANKMAGLKGRMAQAALNKMSESGTSDRIASAMNAKNGASPTNSLGKQKPGGMPSSTAPTDSSTETQIKDKAEETSSNEGSGSVLATGDVVKKGLIVCAAALPIIIFCCLFITSSQVFTNSISLGTADSLSGEEVEEKINLKETTEEDLNQEQSDDDVAYDIYINDSNLIKLRESKLNNYNVVQVANETTYLKRKYNEASLDKIEEFYPPVVDLSKNYDKNMVYDFFFKMYNLYITYRDTYNVYLDLPLLMSTLNLESADKNVIFSSNLSPEDRTKTARKLPIEEFDYYYDWVNSDYKISKSKSNHDMELLASRMVSKHAKETCTNSAGDVTQENILKDNSIGTVTLTCVEGETYKVEDLGYVIDHEKYKDFLKQFIEKKYYLDGEHSIEGEVLVLDNVENDENSNATTPAVGDFTSWKQCDDRWGKINVPKSNQNLCQIGCLVTSITIQIARSGTIVTTETLNPGVAVKEFSFASGGNLYWNSVKNLAPNFVYYTKINLVGMNKKSIADKLTSYDSSRYYIILGVGEKSSNKLHHYVSLDYVDQIENKIYMMDPGSSKTKDLYEVYKLYTAHIYEKKD